MRLRVLGCAGGSAPDMRLSCYLIDDVFAIDAGALTTGLPVEGQRAVEAVALTHGHLDHIWSLPLFLANRFGSPSQTCHLYASSFTMETLQQHLFNDRIWPDFTAAMIENRPLVTFHDVEPGDSKRVLDRYDIQAIPLNHPVPCQAYRIRERESSSLIVCGDTGTTEELWDYANEEAGLRGMLIECSFPDTLRDLANKSGHMTPDLLLADLQKLKRDIPIWVIHMKPGYGEAIERALRDSGDRRIRFIQQDDVIEI